MTDIIERLRYVAGPYSDHDLAKDARLEIERLRSALVEVRESDSIESAWAVATAALHGPAVQQAAQHPAARGEGEK